MGNTDGFSSRDTGRSRGGSLALSFGLLGVFAVAAMLYLRPTPQASLAVVAVHGCSDPCKENLALSLSFVLETQGFEVHERSGEVASTMDELSAIASESYAVHRVFLEVGELTTEADSTFVDVRGEVRSAAEEPIQRAIQIAVEAVREERVDTEPLRDEDAVRIEAGLMAVDALSPDLVSGLLRSEVMAAYLEAVPRNTSTAVSRHGDLAEAHEDDHERVMNARSFDAACEETSEEYAAAGDDSLGITCITPACEQEHLVSIDGNSLTVQRESRFPVFPLRAQHEVVSAPTPYRIFRREDDGNHEERARSRTIAGYASAHGEDVAFVSASDAAFSLFLQSGEEKILVAEAQRPTLLSNPKLGPEWVLFERRPFRDADPVLMASRRNGEGTAIEVTPFGVQGDWVHLGQPLVAVWVAGIRQETRAALEAQGNGERINEAEAIDDLDDDLDAERIARIAAGLPPLDHIALIRLGDEGPQVVQRLGGREFALSYAQATPSGALVLIRASAGVCELLKLRADDWFSVDLGAHTESWVQLQSCPSFPVVAENAVYGTARVSNGDDPLESDMEVVRYDMARGEMTQLTFNAIDERFIRVHEGEDFTRVGFERVPAPRFARFRPSSVCAFREASVQPPPAAETEVSP